MSDQGDLVDRLREESLQLARRSFDSVDAGISANLCDEAIDEIAYLRDQLKLQQGNMAGWLTEKDKEIERLRDAKTAALKIADERAKEAVDLRAQLASARKALGPFAFYYDLNDCHERAEDDALEVPIRDLKAAKVALTDEKST